jgi:hypothetical protein
MNQLNSYGIQLRKALTELRDKLCKFDDDDWMNIQRISDWIKDQRNDSCILKSFQLIKFMCRTYKVINAMVEEFPDIDFMEPVKNTRNEMKNILNKAKHEPSVQKYQGMFDFIRYKRRKVLEETGLIEVNSRLWSVGFEEIRKLLEPQNSCRETLIMESPEDELFKPAK